jgi:transcriptional regulator with XRE-family HTH domain
MTTATIGTLLRDWRVRRGRSQLDVSVDAGVSTRHLSYVETGRSRPSPELVLLLAQHLDVPLRERNQLLLAAGYAPRYGQTSLDDPSMTHVRSSIQRMLDAHDPYPGVAIDRRWDVVLANRAASLLIADVPAHVIGGRPNVHRVCLHPDGLARSTINLTDWATYLVGQLRRTAVLTGDPGVDELLTEVEAYPAVAALERHPSSDRTGVDPGPHDGAPTLLVPFRWASPLGDLELFTTLTTFGTPRDVTLDELAIELFFPADDTTARALSAAQSGSAR